VFETIDFTPDHAKQFQPFFRVIWSLELDSRLKIVAEKYFAQFQLKEKLRSIDLYKVFYGVFCFCSTCSGLNSRH
jgi:hypothetical protein